MNTQSNTYTVIYSAVMVMVVAALLSFASITLKPYQEKNIQVEKKQSILKSVNIGLDANKHPKKNSYVEQLYSKYITNSFIVNSKGEKINGDAFSVDLKKELAKDVSQRKLPVFICKQTNGKTNVIMPIRGKGLWGPIWGYIALESDYATIFGVSFGHKGETPGLGAEIATLKFQKQFAGKTIFDKSGKFVSIEVVKGGAPKEAEHAVDAVSGGTITSKGLQAMLLNGLGCYKAFLKQSKKNIKL